MGVTGQDGSYLAELLLSKNYRVIGVARRVSVPTDERIRHLYPQEAFSVVQGDVTDAPCVDRIIRQNDPFGLLFPNEEPRYEIYNLAAQSHVGTSFDQPGLTTQSTYLGPLNILESIRNNPNGKTFRFYQASSSEIFGSSYSVRYVIDGTEVEEHLDYDNEPPEGRFWEDACERYGKVEPFQSENTPFQPNSPYAIAKLAAHHLCRVYRESYGLFSCSGILHNHESERRSDQFVTRKITRYVAGFKKALDAGKPYHRLKLGNLDAYRDWGHAEDYVRGMWMMLQQDSPDDYVLATGVSHTVRDFLDEAFKVIGVSNWQGLVQVDPSLFRPCEVKFLRGDATKAREKLGWVPTIDFQELVKRMVLSDIGSTN